MQMRPPIAACQIPVVGGTDEKAFSARADQPLVAEHVVRDLEHGESRDPGGEAREPHQRQPDRECEHTADDGGERERRDDCRHSS